MRRGMNILSHPTTRRSIFHSVPGLHMIPHLNRMPLRPSAHTSPTSRHLQKFTQPLAPGRRSAQSGCWDRLVRRTIIFSQLTIIAEQEPCHAFPPPHRPRQTLPCGRA
jgi:hypothetical protein